MKHSVLAALALVVLCLTPPSGAQAQTRRFNMRYHYSALRQAVCYQQWNRAIALVDAIVASRQLSPQAADQMIAYQFYLSQYRRNETRFAAIPGCENQRPNAPSSPASRSPSSPPSSPAELPTPGPSDRP